MKNIALKTAGTIFLLVSLIHLLRFLFKIEVIVGGFRIPFWFSLFGFIVPLLLAVWMFRISNNEKKIEYGKYLGITINIVYFVVAIISSFFLYINTNLDLQRFIGCLFYCLVGLFSRVFFYYGILKREKPEFLKNMRTRDSIVLYIFYGAFSLALVSFIYLVNYESFNKMSFWLFNCISPLLFAVSGFFFVEVVPHLYPGVDKNENKKIS